MLGAPVAPEGTTGTAEPVREAVQQAVVPRWIAVPRTRGFVLLALLGVVMFAVMAVLVTSGLTGNLDLRVTRAVQSVAVPGVGPLMVAVSAPGFSPQSSIMVLCIVGAFVVAGYRTEAVFTLIASLSWVLTELIKLVVGRPRPGSDLVHVISGAGGTSFPSGHTLFYVTFFGFLAYLAYALLKRGWTRVLALCLLGAMILLVGPSRIWMGQHWASDVLASYSLGLAILVLLIQTYSQYRLSAAPAPSPVKPRSIAK